MQDNIQQTLDAITFGTPVSAGAVTIVPLYSPGGPPAPAYRSLENAIAGGEVEDHRD